MSYLLTADLHLKPETAETVMEVLDVFLEQAMELQVQTGVLLGDIYDVRYTVPIALQNRFLDWMEQACDTFNEVLILPGNHDQDDLRGRHALEVFGELARVMTDPVWNEHGLWLPYRRNHAELVEFIQTQPRPDACPNVAWLHHGVQGAIMNNHVVAGELDGLHPDVFDTFDTVFAGHWHRHQEVRNVVYVGSPWQTRADEAGQEKGFVWLDDDGWEHVPIRVGRRYHRVRMQPGVPTPELAEAAPGDRVHLVLEDGVDPVEATKQVQTMTGAEVFIDPPKETYGADRLGLGTAASAVETAHAYMHANAGDLDVTTLAEVFKEVSFT